MFRDCFFVENYLRRVHPLFSIKYRLSYIAFAIMDISYRGKRKNKVEKIEHLFYYYIRTLVLILQKRGEETWEKGLEKGIKLRIFHLESQS